MNDKRKKTLWICAATIIGSYFLRSFLTAYTRMAQQQVIQQPQRPNAPPSNVDTAIATLVAEAAAIGNLSGVWQGRTYMPGRGLCNLRLEMRQHEPGHHSADSRFACLNIDGLATSDPMKMMIERSLPNTNPDAAKFNGMVEKGAIHFHSFKDVGSTWCALTDLTITPGGARQVIAEWKDCQGGHLILQEVAQ